MDRTHPRPHADCSGSRHRPQGAAGGEDPERTHIIDIGLVYDVEVAETGDVVVRMTLTSPGCPRAARSSRT